MIHHLLVLLAAAAALLSPPVPVDLGDAVPWEDRADARPWTPPGDVEFWPTEPPSRFPGLRLRLRLPESVAAGETFDYVVVLHDITQRAVDLRPCPGYAQQALDTGHDLAQEWHRPRVLRLACDDDPLLRPGERRRYAMRLTVPADAIGSELLVAWGLVDNVSEGPAQQWIGLS